MENWSGFRKLLSLLPQSKKKRLKRMAPFEKVTSAHFQMATYKCNRCNCPNERLNYEIRLNDDSIIFPEFFCGACRSSDLTEVNLNNIKNRNTIEFGEIGYFSCPKCNESPMRIGCEIDWD